MQLIKNWIEGKQNYLVGRVLYDQYGNDIALKRLFHNRGETPYNKERLLQELSAIAINKPSAPISAPKLALDPLHSVEPENDILKAIDKEWKPIYQRMKFLQGQMISLGTCNLPATMLTAKDFAEEILQLEQQCMLIWNKRDFFIDNGRLPDAPAVEPEIPTDPIQLGRFVENCKRQIRRMRNNVKQHPNKPAYAQMLCDWKSKYKKATGNDYSEKN